MLVHQRGDLLIFKGFMLHDMAPMAGGIADAKKDGLVLSPRNLKRLVTPGVPLDGVVCMLQKIGTGLMNEFVLWHGSAS